MPFSIWMLLALFGVATATALYAVAFELQRRAYLRRARAPQNIASRVGSAAPSAAVADHPALRFLPRLLERLGDVMPGSFLGGGGIGRLLDRAGFDHPGAPLVYAGAHLLWAGLALTLGVVLAPRDDARLFALSLALALALAVFTPRALLDRMVAVRQQRIRLGVPDALDLLVVCIDAGTALDASLQRVARELGSMHDELSAELIVMTRRMAAGMTRADAMAMLYERTGVPELRALTTHLVQSERWGTSVATVLRVYARDLRRKRRLFAEKRAATASTRMLLPLALFIFPTIFIVVLGPAILQITAAFRGMGS